MAPLQSAFQSTTAPTVRSLRRRKEAQGHSALPLSCSPPLLSTGVQKIPRRPKKRAMKTPTQPRTDVILAMQEPYMQQIVTGEKTYEFRRYRLSEDVKRVWFYRTAPYSSLDYVCEIEPARTRGPGLPALEEAGLGNDEFNNWHRDWEGYDFAYKILSVHRLKEPIGLADLHKVHGMKSAPRGWMYTPQSIVHAVTETELAKVL